MSLSFDEMLKLWPIVVTIGGIVLAGVLWRFRGEFATKADVSELRSEGVKTAQRLERIERDMQHLPTREDIHRIQLGMTEIKGSLGEMRVEARGDRELLSRVETAMARHEDIISSRARSGGMA
ncbi:DUF2730 family protein [Humitalea sp. 24SJ18S-53]|uniref:DUF2730 family protein n=1 Tax=Humitalea sp. 24SJ18S-53 TaxID=3422307 RepID=UPI003D665E95